MQLRGGRKTESPPSPALRDPDGWEEAIRSFLLGGGNGIVHLIGVGNPIRRDDGVGLNVVSLLRKELGPSPRPNVRIHPPSLNPERLISRAVSGGGRLVIFDAVEANRAPGSIVCASLAESKFGFFATHNLPLKLIPGVMRNPGGACVVGIQPESLDVGEGLSDSVGGARRKLVKSIAGMMGGTE